MRKSSDTVTDLFPVVILFAAGTALWKPSLFAWFRGPWITSGLGFIMLGMGLSLKVEDFIRVIERPRRVFAGLLLQYGVMPLLAVGLSRLFGLSDAMAAGLILVGCCPGGTASNVISYLARADVPLSVTMTAVSTLTGIFMTPLLTVWLASSQVEIHAWPLLVNMIQVVLIPVAAGIAINRFFHKTACRILPFAPAAAMMLIALIVASVMGSSRSQMLAGGFRLIISVACLHAGGFFLGYILAKILVRQENPARTISIEVGMQNSGLGVLLSQKHFPDPSSALPGAVASLVQNLLGSLLASYWQKRSVADSQPVISSLSK